MEVSKSTPSAFLHASVRFGGLRVLQLRRWIPEIRMSKATASNDRFMADVSK